MSFKLVSFFTFMNLNATITTPVLSSNTHKMLLLAGHARHPHLSAQVEYCGQHNHADHACAVVSLVSVHVLCSHAAVVREDVYGVDQPH